MLSGTKVESEFIASSCTSIHVQINCYTIVGDELFQIGGLSVCKNLQPDYRITAVLFQKKREFFSCMSSVSTSIVNSYYLDANLLLLTDFTYCITPILAVLKNLDSN